MPLPQIYTSYVNRMVTSLLLGIIAAEMGLTVEDIFGNVVNNVTLIDFVRESFVSEPAVHQSDIHGDTGWWRLSNTTGHIEESMFNVDSTGANLSPGMTSILRTVQTLDGAGNIYQGLTTNMSNLASGTATLDDNTKPSWYVGPVLTTSNVAGFEIAALDPGSTNLDLLTNLSGLFNISKNLTTDTVEMDMYPDFAENGFINLWVSGTPGHSAEFLIFTADNSEFDWQTDGAGTTKFKLFDGVSNALFQWDPTGGTVFTATENTGNAIIEAVKASGTQGEVFAFSPDGASIILSASSNHSNAFIHGSLGAGPLWFQVEPGALLVENAAGTGSLFEVQDGLPVLFGGATFAANAAVATSLTGVGPTGAHTTVQEWLVIQHGSGGPSRYIPCF